MGGITQCPACGDLYYGDERDDFATCRCPTLSQDEAFERIYGKTMEQAAHEIINKETPDISWETMVQIAMESLLTIIDHAPSELQDTLIDEATQRLSEFVAFEDCYPSKETPE